ncbi:MAG: phytoene desaturase [Akkermansiaceae bacterium]|nr:phytoene desaturase [Akkermansiaceae bacterium]MCP5543279.1 phytoene desaturase [Akkermansiaceae bacterium]
MPSSHRNPHIVIVGAGPGGLTAGLLLAHRGCKVTILEKEGHVGGRNSALEFDGFSFDLGPTFLHQKFCLDEIFAETGTRTEDHLDIVNLSPMTRLSWGDKSLHTFSDRGRMEAELERVFPGSVPGFQRYMDEQAKKFRIIYPCLQRPYQTATSYLSRNLMRALPYVLTTRSVHDVLGRYFDDERLKLAFTFQAKYLGMSPWHCPALFSILSYTEYRFGVYHVQGGLNRISHAMAGEFGKRGGDLRLSTPVKRLVYQGRKATGVELADGSRIDADAVVVNADFGHAATRLFGDRSVSEGAMRRKRFSCSTFMIYLGIDGIYPDEPHHHILFADDYQANVADIQSERRVSEDMSIYVRNSSVTDPRVAPEGKSGLYILVPTINHRHGFDWDAIKEEYADKVLRRIEQRTGMKDLRSRIVAKRIVTPADWEASSIFLGATFNLAHTLGQMLYMRPHNEWEGAENCYLVGGGTHPGSGLPTIYESGRISANLVCDRFGVPYQSVDLASGFMNGE